MRRSLVLVLVSVAAMATVACSDDGDAACPLTPEVVSETAGVEITSTESIERLGGAGCTYEYEGGGIDVLVEEGAAEDSQSELLVSAEDEESFDVDGREGIWSPGIAMMDVSDGDDALRIQVEDLAEESLTDATKVALDLMRALLDARG